MLLLWTLNISIHHLSTVTILIFYFRSFALEIYSKTQKTESLQTLRLIVYFPYPFHAPDDTIIRAILLFSSDFCFRKLSPLNRIGAHLSSIRS